MAETKVLYLPSFIFLFFRAIRVSCILLSFNIFFLFLFSSFHLLSRLLLHLFIHLLYTILSYPFVLFFLFFNLNPSFPGFSLNPIVLFPIHVFPIPPSRSFLICKFFFYRGPPPAFSYLDPQDLPLSSSQTFLPSFALGRGPSTPKSEKRGGSGAVRLKSSMR